VTGASLNRKVAALETRLASKDNKDESANDDESVDQDESSGGCGNRKKCEARSLSVMRLVRALAALQDHGEGLRLELDSHADTCVIGKDSLVIHDFDRPVNVTGYEPNQPVAKALQTVSAALAYDNPVNGEVIILVVHQAIHIPHLSHNLLSPFQMRLSDVTANDAPRFLTDNPTEITHTLSVPGVFGTGDEYVIPLDLFGVSSGFPTRKPTGQEYKLCD
jgi:hypothetical protein